MHRIIFTGNRIREMYLFRRGVILACRNKGYEVIVLTPLDHPDSIAFFQSEGCRVIPLEFERKNKNPLANLSMLLKIKKIYKEIAPDFIFHYTVKPNIWGTLAAKTCHIPSVAVTTGLGYAFTKKSIASRIIKKLYKIALRYSREVWFLNEDDQQEFLQAKLCRPKQAFILPSEGIDTTYFSPIETKEKKNTINFLMIARLTKEKGTYKYCEAAKAIKQRYPDTNFLLVGEINKDNAGCIEESYIRQMHSNGVIDYIGTTQNIRAYISMSDCVVLPSYYREGIPMSLMEGASMGKALITTNRVGCKEVVEDEKTGYLCKAKDVKDLIQKMERFILLPEQEKQKMGELGREKMLREFDEKRIISIYLDKLNSWLGKK